MVGGKARGEPRPRAPTLTEQGIAEKSPLDLVSLVAENDRHTTATEQKEEEQRPVKRQSATSGGD